MVNIVTSINHRNRHNGIEVKGKGKVIPLQARCGPEDGKRYSSTLP